MEFLVAMAKRAKKVGQVLKEIKEKLALAKRVRKGRKG